MSVTLFVVLFLFGAAAVAAWFYVRFPTWRSEDVRVVMCHVGAAFMAGGLLLPVLMDAVPGPLGVMTVAFPILVYTLLTSMWILKCLQAQIEGRMLR
jgi:nitrate/nitrite transporter NarK